MDLFNIPDWAKRLGVFGIIVFIAIGLLYVFFEAVFQQEAQSFWTDKMKPFLLLPINVNFSVQTWILGLVILGIVVLLVIYFVRLRRPSHRKYGKIDSSSLALPKSSDSVMNQSHVFRAVKETRAHRFDEQDLAKIVEQAVNQHVIKAEVGVELLSEFDYVLIYNFDKTYTTQKKWRDK